MSKLYNVIISYLWLAIIFKDRSKTSRPKKDEKKTFLIE